MSDGRIALTVTYLLRYLLNQTIHFLFLISIIGHDEWIIAVIDRIIRYVCTVNPFDRPLFLVLLLNKSVNSALLLG